MESFIYILRSILALIVVVWVANIALRYLNNLSIHDKKSIQIVERISVSKASSLAIVKIVNDYYLMSFSDNSTEILQKFTPEEVIEIEKRIEMNPTMDPKETFNKFDFKQLKGTVTEYFEQSKLSRK